VKSAAENNAKPTKTKKLLHAEEFCIKLFYRKFFFDLEQWFV
jgi:hypothetical protein